MELRVSRALFRASHLALTGVAVLQCREGLRESLLIHLGCTQRRIVRTAALRGMRRNSSRSRWASLLFSSRCSNGSLKVEPSDSATKVPPPCRLISRPLAASFWIASRRGPRHPEALGQHPFGRQSLTGLEGALQNHGFQLRDDVVGQPPLTHHAHVHTHLRNGLTSRRMLAVGPKPHKAVCCDQSLCPPD